MSAKTYSGRTILVSFEGKRCIHAAECVGNLPQVFDPKARPWIQPTAADDAAVAAVVRRCPTGALTYAWQDGRAGESPEPDASVRVARDGPLFCRGDLTLNDANGKPVANHARMALCRCGASHNKPYCDGTHTGAGFADPALFAHESAAASARDPGASAAVCVTPHANGPLHVEGPLTLYAADGTLAYRGDDTWLCRCGGSADKPFCDGTHKRIGFTSQ
jgi:CDGSH-type Zn-finger protein/uncharacterized Fe-S cluster protein YjdI